MFNSKDWIYLGWVLKPASTAAHQLCFTCHMNAWEENLKPFSSLPSVRIWVFLLSYCCGNAARIPQTLSNLPKQRREEFSHVPFSTEAKSGDGKPANKGCRDRNTGWATEWLKTADLDLHINWKAAHSRSRAVVLGDEMWLLPHLEVGACPAHTEFKMVQ